MFLILTCWIYYNLREELYQRRREALGCVLAERPGKIPQFVSRPTTDSSNPQSSSSSFAVNFDLGLEGSGAGFGIASIAMTLRPSPLDSTN
jgi:hypothetical protein